MKSGFLYSADISSGFGLGLSPILNRLNRGSGPKKQIEWDAEKKYLQSKIRDMGYGQFDQMSGWEGDEEEKYYAMEYVYAALIQYGDKAAVKITGWLDGGKITPATIQKIQSQNWQSETNGNGGSEGGDEDGDGVDWKSKLEEFKNRLEAESQKTNEIVTYLQGEGEEDDEDDDSGTPSWLPMAALGGAALVLVMSMR